MLTPIVTANVPIAIFRSATTLAFANWRSSAASVPTYWNFPTASLPDGTPGLQDCVTRTSSGIWDDVDCAATYTKAVCMSTQYPYVGYVTYRQPASYYSNSATYALTLTLPNTATLVYGATVTVRMSTCQIGDRFVITVNNDAIGMVSEANCMLKLAGVATLTQYRTLLLGLVFVAANSKRKTLIVDFVYWESLAMREIAYDSATTHFFLPIVGTSKLNAATAPITTIRTVESQCAAIGMYPATINSAAENAEVLRQVTTPSPLGLVRAVGTDPFQWPGPVAMAWNDFFILGPQGGNLCAQISANGRWDDISCDTFFTNYACEKDSYTAANYGTSGALAFPDTRLEVFSNKLLQYDSNGDLMTNVLAGTDLAWLPTTVKNDTFVYGASVQLAMKQCLSSDILKATGTKGTVTYVAAVCTLQIAGAATLADYKADLLLVKFSLSSVASPPLTAAYIAAASRISLTFNYMIWTQSTMSQLLLDEETRMVYSFYDSASAITWDMAYQRCRDYGAGWRMARITSKRVADLVRAQISGTLSVPIGHRRAVDDGEFQIWSYVGLARLYFQEWKAGEPSAGSGAFHCTATSTPSATKGQWEPVSCASTFKHILCERDSWDYSYSVTYRMDTADMGYHATAGLQANIFAAAAIPSSTTLYLYGATMQQRQAQCRFSDNFLLGQVNNLISVINGSACQMILAGYATESAYSVVIKDVDWVTVHTGRRNGNIYFQWVVWNTPGLREVIMDYPNSRMYTSLFSSNMYTPDASYNFLTATAFCTNLGGTWAMTQITSYQEHMEAMRVVNYGPSWIDATRASSAVDFLWGGSTAMTYKDFRPWGPESGASDLCLKLEVPGMWTETPCNTRLTSVTCEAPLAATSGSITKILAATLVTFCDNVNCNRHITWSGTLMDGYIFPTEASKNLLGWASATTSITRSVYGATVTLNRRQCESGDTISSSILDVSLYASYDAPRCALRITNPAPIGVYVGMGGIGGLQFTASNTKRSNLTFNYVLWINNVDPSFNAYMESNSRFVYLPVFAGTSTWQAAWARCRQLGLGWRLPTVRNLQVKALLAPLVSIGNSIPLNHYRGTTTGEMLAYDSALYSYQSLKYQEWKMSVPSNGKLCTRFLQDTAEWEDVDCVGGSGSFNSLVVCERDEWDFSLSINWYRYDPAGAKSLTPFNSLTVGTATQTFYGATLLINARHCHQFDRFFLTASDTDIMVYNDSDCVLMLSGAALRSQYNAVIKKVGLQTTYWHGRRGDGTNPIRVGCIFWTTAFHLNMMMDVDDTSTFHYYTTLYTRVAFSPPAGYNFNSAASVCGALGMSLVELTNDNERFIVQQSIRYGPSWVGATRATGTSSYSWSSAFTYNGIRTWGPSNDAAKLCLRHENNGDWTETDCSTFLTSVTCEGAPFPTYTTDWYAVGTVGSTHSLTTTTYFKFSAANDIVVFSDSSALKLAVSSPVDWLTSDRYGDARAHIAGASVYLAPHQCLPAYDTIYVTGTISGLITPTYDPSTCTMLLVGLDHIGNYGYNTTAPLGALNQLRFKSTYQCDTRRTSLTFATVLWTDTRLINLWMSIDTRHVFAYMNSATSLSWEGAYQRCIEFGTGWKLAEASSNMTRNYINSTHTLNVPIRHRRFDAADSFRRIDMSQGTTAPNPIQFWDLTTYPTATAGDDCVYMRASDGKWANGPCNTATFTQIVCERDSWDFSYIATYVLKSTAFSYRGVVSVFTAGELPASSTNPVYGATIHLALDGCRPLDYALMDATHHDIFIAEQGDCYMILAGASTVAGYNGVVSNVDYYPYDSSRQTAAYTMNLIYWTSPVLQIAFSQGGHYYVALTSNVAFESPVAYPYWNVSTACSFFGMYPSEITTAAENSFLAWIGRPSLAFYGAQRPSSGSSYQWVHDGSTVTYTNWLSSGPSSLSNKCVRANSVGTWVDGDCTTVTPCVICEADSSTAAMTVRSNSQSMATTSGNYPIDNTGSDLEIGGFSSTTHLMTGNVFINAQLASILTGAASTACNIRVFGSSATLAIHHCDAGYDEIRDPLALPAGFSRRYDWSTCALHTYGLGILVSGGNGHAEILARLKFYAVRKKLRKFLHFSWMLWTQNNTQDMLMDVENRHVYTPLQSSTLITWLQAQEMCRSIGTGWDMATDTSVRSRALIRAFLNASTSKVPINLRRNATNGAFSLWTSSGAFEPVFMQDWHATQPSNPAHNCLMANALLNGGQWDDISCTDPLFSTVLCERASAEMGWSQNRNIPESWIPNTFGGAKNPFQSVEPAQGATIIYGASIFTSLTTCFPFDNYYSYNYVSNLITMVSEGWCNIHFGGERSMDEYYTQLKALRWRSVYKYRNHLTHMYIYWTQRSMREVYMDDSLANVYMVMPSTVSRVPDASYPFYSADSLCTSLGMHIAELSSGSQLLAALRTNISSAAWLAASRTGGVGSFTWPSGGFPLIPGTMHTRGTTNGENCLQQDPEGPWTDIPCSVRLNYTLCMGSPISAWFNPTSLSAVNNFIGDYCPFGLVESCPYWSSEQDAYDKNQDDRGDLPEYYRIGETTQTNPHFNIFDENDFLNRWKGFDNSVVVYGASSQILSDHCHPEWGDNLTLTGLPTTMTQTYEPMLCTLTITGVDTLKKYVDMLQNIVWLSTNREDRMNLMASFVIWTHPNDTLWEGFYYDHTQDELYAAKDVPIPMSWDDAETLCRHKGLGWHMASIRLNRTAHLFRMKAGANKVPVFHRRSGAGTFGTVDPATNTILTNYFNDWAAASPDGTAGVDDCVALDPALGGLDDVPCNTALFNTIICEAPATVRPIHDRISYVFRVRDYDGVQPVRPWAGGAAPSGSDVIYGATLQSFDECNMWDRFVPDISHKYIGYSRAEDCLLMLSGDATKDQYSAFLSWMYFVAGSRVYDRTKVSFSLIYWTDFWTREIMRDPHGDNHFYTPLTGRLWYTARANYPYYSMADLCAARGSYLAEITTQEEALFVESVIATHGPAHLGATRLSNSDPYTWPTAGSLQFQDFYRTEPQANGNRCLQMDPWGGWSAASCTAVASAAVCEVNSFWAAVYSGVSLPAFYPRPPKDYFRRCTLGGASEFHSMQLGGFSDVSSNVNPIDWVYVSNEDPSSVSGIFGRRHVMYGASWQLSWAQCRGDGAGDLINTPSEPSPLPYSTAPAWTIQRPLCSEHLKGPALLSYWAKALWSIVFYAQGDTSRVSYTFAFMIHRHPWIKYMYTDTETRKVIAVVDVATAITWDAARVICRQLGNKWKMLQIAHARESQMLRKAAGGLSVPLYMKRNSSGAFNWWNDSDITQYVPAYFNDWDTGKPDSTYGVQDCAAMTGANGYWDDVDCASALYTRVMCETFELEHYETITHSTLFDEIQSITNFSFTAFQTADLPNSVVDNRAVYGATVTSDNCHFKDRFVPESQSHDNIVMINQGLCIAMFAGVADVDGYNTQLLGLSWKGTFPFRSVVHFSYIYWVSPLTRDLIMYPDNGHSFNSLYSAMQVDPSSSPYPFYDAVSQCQHIGAYPVEVSDFNEMNIVVKTQSWGNTLIGSHKTGSTFTWMSGAMMIFNDWYPLEPNTPTFACVVQKVGGGWRDFNCSERIQSVSCEIDINPLSGFSTHNVTQPGPIVNATARFVLKFDTAAVAKLTPSKFVFGDISGVAGSNPLSRYVDWLQYSTNNLRMFWGATVQISPYTCFTTQDVLSYDSAVAPIYPELTSSYKPSTCLLEIKYFKNGAFEKGFMTEYRNVLARVYMTTTNVVRRSISFSFVLWTDQQTTSMYMDLETRHVYTVITSVTPKTWYEAYQACRSYAPGFSLAEVTNSYVNAFYKSVQTTKDLPLNFVRNTTGIFGLWRDPASAPTYYWDWASTAPDGIPGADDCVFMNASLGGQWDDGPCDTPLFTLIPCMNSTWDWSGAAIWVIDPATVPATAAMVVDPFPTGTLVDSDALILGATIQTPTTLCHVNDHFYMRPGFQDAWIQLYRDEDCLMMLTGRRLVSEYNFVLSKLQFRGTYAYRSTLTFGWIYWTHPQVRDMVMDFVTGHVYTSFKGRMSWDSAPSGYAGYRAPDVCRDVGFYAVEINNKTENDEVRRTTLLATSFIGARRQAAGSPFTYLTSGTPIEYLDWYPASPVVVQHPVHGDGKRGRLRRYQLHRLAPGCDMRKRRVESTQRDGCLWHCVAKCGPESRTFSHRNSYVCVHRRREDDSKSPC